MNKTISMSIRVSEEELDKLKQAARIEAYASYSEFIRRTALIEGKYVIICTLPFKKTCRPSGRHILFLLFGSKSFR